MYSYGFLEVCVFDLDDFIPHMGWIGAKPVKIYTRDQTCGYYLYDEASGRLFECQFNAHDGENTKLRYDQVLDDYQNWKQSQPPGNSNIHSC
ncbi:hypothetical protein SAMN05216327_11213 [Dyadobacter sp. SG02]|nr:hypothetical protein SAMN05216327_11213 [Dyadobacter sp. SG02]